MILAQICDEISCGQGKVYGQTDERQRQYRIRTERLRVNDEHFPEKRVKCKFSKKEAMVIWWVEKWNKTE